MFSTLKNQSKATELIQKAHETIEEATARIDRAKERFVEAVSRSDNIRERIGKKSIVKFQNLLKRMRNEPPAELPPLSDTLFIEQSEPLIEMAETKTPAVARLAKKKGWALFLSFFTAVLTVGVAFLIAALATGKPLKIETFTQKESIEAMLRWIGGGAYDPSIGNTVYGAIGLGLAALAAALIVWSMVMSGTSKRNLKNAEASLLAIENYADETTDAAETMEYLASLLEKYYKDMEICDSFINEFNASLERILLTEGEDYDKLSDASKQALSRAIDTVTSVIPLLNITILTTENGVSGQLENAVKEAENCVRKLLKESGVEMPAQESSEVIVLGYAEKEENQVSKESSSETPEASDQAEKA